MSARIISFGRDITPGSVVQQAFLNCPFELKTDHNRRQRYVSP